MRCPGCAVLTGTMALQFEIPIRLTISVASDLPGPDSMSSSRGSFMGAGGIPAPVNSEIGAFGAAVAS